jgi:hypothetical protein
MAGWHVIFDWLAGESTLQPVTISRLFLDLACDIDWLECDI